MDELDFHQPTDPDDDLPSHAFYVETHFADAMPLPHWHDHIEVNLLESGRMDYLLNGRRVTLEAGRLAIFWAAIHHQAISVEPNQRLYCAYLPVNLFLSLPVAPGFRSAVLRGALVQSDVADPTDAPRFARVIESWAQSPEALRMIYRDELLLRLRRMSFETATEVARPPRYGSAAAQRSVLHVEKLTAHINDNLADPLNVDEICHACGLHPTTARAAFRKVLGLGLGAYIRRQRLSLAMRMLAETDLSVADVAHLAGYGSMTRLYDAFRQLAGRTPSAFRASLRGEAGGRVNVL